MAAVTALTNSRPKSLGLCSVHHKFTIENIIMKKHDCLFINTEQYVTLIMDGIASGGGSPSKARNTCEVTQTASRLSKNSSIAG